MAKESKPRAGKKDQGTKAAKAKKDPNAPKRPLSAYMFFSQEHRSIVKDENPEASFGELAVDPPSAASNEADASVSTLSDASPFNLQATSASFSAPSGRRWMTTRRRYIAFFATSTRRARPSRVD